DPEVARRQLGGVRRRARVPDDRAGTREPQPVRVDRLDVLAREVVRPDLDVVELRQVRCEQRPDRAASDDADPHEDLLRRGSRSWRPPVIPVGLRISTSAMIAARTTCCEPLGRSSLSPRTWTPCSAWLRNEASPLTARAPTTAPQRLVSPPMTSIARVRN